MSYTQQHVVAEGETPASSSYFNAEMTYVYNSLNTEAAAIAAHIADTADAHDASAISVADTGENFTGTNVESVLAEVQADLDGRFSTETGHDHDGTDSAKIPESSLNLTDVTTGNVSTSAHGFVPKAPGDANKFLNGLGAWSTVGIEVIGNQDSDDTEYSTSSTSYTLKKTFTFTTSAACMGLLYIQHQMKSSIDTVYAKVRYDLDDVVVYNPISKSTSYIDVRDYRLVVLSAGEHTLKVYMTTDFSSATAYAQLFKWVLIGVKTA